MLWVNKTKAIVIPLLYTLLLSLASTTTASIINDVPKNNPLGIDWYPAPSPEEGPPLSASALRDKSRLPAEIGGILGAYVFVVAIVGTALILLRRKHRFSAQIASKVLDIEMVEPRTLRDIDTSLHSPGAYPSSPRNFSWPSPENDAKNPYVFPTNGLSPTTPVGTDPYVDAGVVEADQEMMQRDLEDLYAHVMEQEDAKKNGANVKEMAPPPMLQRAMASLPAEAPQRQESPKKVAKNRPSNLSLEEQKPKSHSRTSSIISALKSPRWKKEKELRISAPILTPTTATFYVNSDEEPLTPKYYKPPPPIPTDQVPFNHIRQSSSGDSPTRSIASQLSPYGNSSSHRPNLSQTSMASSGRGDPISATSATSQTPLFSGPTALSLQAPPSKFASQIPYQNPYAQQHTPATASTPAPARALAPIQTSTSTRALPFRSFEPALTSPSFKPQITKTTVLERTAQGNGPNTSGLKTPWSAGAVPYSPYQPFTPMMPVTPRLVTREERKARKKVEGRTPVLEMVGKEDDWGSAY